MSEHTESVGLVERLRETHTCDGCGEYVGSIIHDLCDEAASALASERAAHADVARALVEALKAPREARREISKTHKNAVKHENCERQHCPICAGGLFQCADCGAAEIETEQRVCTGSEARLAEALKALEPFARVAEHDIGESEADDDLFRPMERHNRAPRLTVGHLRAARRVREGGKADGQ